MDSMSAVGIIQPIRSTGNKNASDGSGRLVMLVVALAERMLDVR